MKLGPGRKLLIWVGPGWPMLNSNSFSFSDKDQLQYFDTIVELANKLPRRGRCLQRISENVGAAGLGYVSDFLKVCRLLGRPTPET